MDDACSEKGYFFGVSNVHDVLAKLLGVSKIRKKDNIIIIIISLFKHGRNMFNIQKLFFHMSVINVYTILQNTNVPLKIKSGRIK